MNKIEARKFAKAQISKMSSAQKEWASGAIADALSGLFEFTHAPKVFVYLGTDGEPNTEEIVGLALMLEKVVCVPRVCGEDLKAIAISPFTNFKTNKWGILEPVGSHSVDDPTVALVPMVAFDGLKRAGHGKGYYDRFLEKNPQAIKCGVAFSTQVSEKPLTLKPHDVPMNYIVAPKNDPEKENPHVEEATV